AAASDAPPTPSLRCIHDSSGLAARDQVAAQVLEERVLVGGLAPEADVPVRSDQVDRRRRRAVALVELAGRVGENRSRPVGPALAGIGSEDEVLGHEVAVLLADARADGGE